MNVLMVDGMLRNGEAGIEGGNQYRREQKQDKEQTLISFQKIADMITSRATRDRAGYAGTRKAANLPAVCGGLQHRARTTRTGGSPVCTWWQYHTTAFEPFATTGAWKLCNRRLQGPGFLFLAGKAEDRRLYKLPMGRPRP